jgi:hypothetical protein
MKRDAAPSMALYHDDPLCFRCRDPLVVHRGAAHDGACCGIRCKCASFIAEVAA